MKEAANTGMDVKAMFDKSGGDYSKVSAEDKAKYVKSFNGDEKAASEFWGKMKSGSVGGGGPAAPKR
ncbi:hypothetical protein OP10G_4221 [Fimbriimonas ginsengisoli Gsoil 348]|uniref:Uncharacterized protein n=2 Tax=Fimbriimonas ginsengisoli TaxID=1005039 RepID=A0A068NYX6_FIMGI|nr:hypothetical protein OP10G_4221 [Fimbriimonas ginsengisoli Gsoil 348]